MQPRPNRSNTPLILIVAGVGLLVSLVPAGDLNPPAGPIKPTGHSLEEIHSALIDSLATNVPKLYNKAFRELTEGEGGTHVIFTAPADKSRFITGIYSNGGGGEIMIDGQKVLVVGTVWSAGGGAPIVVGPGQTVTVETHPIQTVSLTVTGYEF